MSQITRGIASTVSGCLAEPLLCSLHREDAALSLGHSRSLQPCSRVTSSGLRGQLGSCGVGALLQSLARPHVGPLPSALQCVDHVFLSGWQGKDLDSGWATEKASWLSV